LAEVYFSLMMHMSL